MLEFFYVLEVDVYIKLKLILPCIVFPSRSLFFYFYPISTTGNQHGDINLTYPRTSLSVFSRSNTNQS